MESTHGAPTVLMLPLDAIRPNPAQPRQSFDPVGLENLAASMREHGVLQPVLVRPIDPEAYELIAGERRWQAARRAGLAAIPAQVVTVSPRRALELALIENVQRADLTPLEEAEAYRNLMAALGLTHERLAERLGMSRVAVTNRLRLLSLSPVVREALTAGRITEGHARVLLALDGTAQAGALATVEAARLTVRQTEQLVRRLSRPTSPRSHQPDQGLDSLAENLRQSLGARVRARRVGAGVSVLIHFHAIEAAYAMAEALRGEQHEDDL